MPGDSLMMEYISLIRSLLINARIFIFSSSIISEGKNSIQIIKELADEQNINIPITTFVNSVLTGLKPYIAFNQLWKTLKEEIFEKNQLLTSF